MNQSEESAMKTHIKFTMEFTHGKTCSVRQERNPTNILFSFWKTFLFFSSSTWRFELICSSFFSHLDWRSSSTYSVGLDDLNRHVTIKSVLLTDVLPFLTIWSSIASTLAYRRRDSHRRVHRTVDLRWTKSRSFAHRPDDHRYDTSASLFHQTLRTKLRIGFVQHVRHRRLGCQFIGLPLVLVKRRPV